MQEKNIFDVVYQPQVNIMMSEDIENNADADESAT